MSENQKPVTEDYRTNWGEIFMSNKLTNNPLNVQDIEQFTKHEQENKMNTEPVAWICDAFEVDFEEQGWAIATPHKDKERFIPLYTHPAKTLSKDDLLKLAEEFDIWLGNDDIKFIQFVLRKAQEK